jgi:hypothetical protein
MVRNRNPGDRQLPRRRRAFFREGIMEKRRIATADRRETHGLRPEGQARSQHQQNGSKPERLRQPAPLRGTADRSLKKIPKGCIMIRHYSRC